MIARLLPARVPVATDYRADEARLLAADGNLPRDVAEWCYLGFALLFSVALIGLFVVGLEAVVLANRWQQAVVTLPLAGAS